jgi:protein arginine kinase activator
MPLMCQVCGKRPAKIHYTEIVNHSVVTKDLCLECADDKGIDVMTAGGSGLGDLVAGVWDSAVEAQAEKIGKVICPVCGYAYSDFKKMGRFGCPDCYEAFESQLAVLLRQIHGSTQHRGKSPVQLGPMAMIRRELADLKEELSVAVQREDFERAAVIRDRIKEIETRTEEP